MIVGKLDNWFEIKVRLIIEKVFNGKIIINVFFFLYIYVLDSVMYYFYRRFIFKGVIYF